MTGVMIGVDPHKGSHTAVVLDQAETVLGQIRVIARGDQLERLQQWAATWPDRIWAIEGARGLGQFLTQQLLGVGERVVDVAPKLAARVRLLNTGQVNKNDPNDARSVAVAALRARDLREVSSEDDTAVLRVWARRYHDLGSLRTQAVCRLHAVLCELVPGGFSKRISAPQAIRVLDGLVVHGAIAQTRLDLARDLVEDLQRIDAQRREVKRRTSRAVAASGTSVTEVYGWGRSWPPQCSATSATSAVSRPVIASPPTTAPPRSRSRPGTGRFTGFLGAGTGSSTTRSTWPRSARSATTAPPAGPTTSARSRRAWDAKPHSAR